jgi:ectoine hydroxylase
VLLSTEQIATYEREGFLEIPSLFSETETAVLRADLARIFSLDRPEVPRSASGVPLLAHRLERYSEAFALLLRHPRMVEPAMQLLDGPVYSHQFKVVTKPPFGKLDLPWHQDYGTWHAIDEMPECRAMNFALFLHDVNEFNGPMILIPRSHQEGVLDAPVEPLDGSSAFAKLSDVTVTRLADAHGMVAPKGVAGTGLFFHGCLAHASVPNISPWPRDNVYSSLNHVENGIRNHGRPEFYANHKIDELIPLPDDCLKRFAQEQHGVRQQ